MKKYYAENREKFLASAKKWRKENRERYRLGRRKISKNRRARLSEEKKKELNQRGWKNRKQRLDADIEFREKKRAYLSKYYQENKGKYKKPKHSEVSPEKLKILRERGRRQTQKRTAQKRNLVSDLTQEQWETILKMYDYRCAYCGTNEKKLTQDHVIPVAKGGGYTMGNIVPACTSCNPSKGDRKPPKPVQTVLI